MRRGALRGSGSRGERSRRLCARSAALCAGRGGAAGQTKAQSRSAGSQRVTRGHRHRRAPRPKPRWPEVAVRGRTAPARRSALPKQPKAPSRDARPCPALLLPLRDGTSPAPPPGAPHRAAGAAPLARVRHLPPLRVSAPCPAVRGPAPARPPPPAPPARRGHALAATVGSGFAAAAGGSVRTGASGSTAPGTRAAPAAPRWPSPVPAQSSPDGTGRSGAPSHPHARTCRQPSDIPPAVAAPGERGGGGAGLLLPSDGVAEPRDRPPPPPPSEGKSNVLLSKASSTLQNIPPRFCRGRGLPAPRPAKQAGSGSALRSAMAGTGRHRAGGAPAAAQRPPPTAAPRPLGAPPAAPGASPRRPPPRAALRSDGGAAPRTGPPQMDTEPSRCWGLCRGSRGARGQLLNNGRVWS